MLIPTNNNYIYNNLQMGQMPISNPMTGAYPAYNSYPAQTSLTGPQLYGQNPMPVYAPYNAQAMGQYGMQVPVYNSYPTQAQMQTQVMQYPAYPANYYVSNPIQTQNTSDFKVNIPPEIKTQSDKGDWKLSGIQKTPYGENIYKYTLKNGQTVALMPRENATTIIKTFVDAGSMNEYDYNRGISHFNEHNVFNGSKRLEAGKFFREVGKLGAQTNASTNYAQTDFYIMSPIVDDKTLKQIIEMHADMLVNPTFPADMVEKERGPVTSEISMCNDDMTNRAVTDLIRNLFQIDSKSEDLIAGSISTVNSITRDDVYNHWKKHFTPDNMYTVLTGDFDPNDAIEIISQNFTTPPVQNADAMRKKETLTPLQKSVRTDYISPTDASTSVFCAFAGPTPGNYKDDMALSALGLLLFGDNSARLTSKLNGMYASGNFMSQKVGLKQTDPEALMFYFAAQGGDDSKVIDEFYNSAKSVLANPPTDDEMTIIKNKMLKALASSFENSEDITDTIGTALLDGEFEHINEYKKLIENLTPNDIANVVNKYIDFGKMSVSVVHPHYMTESDIQSNYLKSPNAMNKNQVAFTGKTPRVISTKNVEQMTLNDNSTLALNDSKSENCYLDWRLTCKDVIPANPACSYVLTQILNDGSKFKSKADFSKSASLKSVSFDTNANAFQIETKASCLYTNTADAINAMREAIYAPRFTKADFNAAVQKVKTYCSSMNKDASTNLLAKLFGKYFPSPKQILKGLETLTLDDVKAHYDNLIFNSSSNFVVSAPLSKNPELKNQIMNNLETKTVKFREYAPMLMPSFVPNDKAVVLLDTEERNQAQIYKNYSFKMHTGAKDGGSLSDDIKDEIKFELLNTILGGGTNSRLFDDLREKQKLAYTTSSQIQSFEDAGILTMRILSTTDDKKQNDIKYDNLQKCLDGFQQNTDRLMNEYVSDEELEAAKKQLKQDIAMQLELPASATALISMNMTLPYGIKRIDEYVKTIDTITKQDIMDAAKHVFSNKPVYSILASKDTVNNQMNYINSLGEVINI